MLTKNSNNFNQNFSPKYMRWKTMRMHEFVQSRCWTKSSCWSLGLFSPKQYLTTLLQLQDSPLEHTHASFRLWIIAQNVAVSRTLCWLSHGSLLDRFCRQLVLSGNLIMQGLSLVWKEKLERAPDWLCTYQLLWKGECCQDLFSHVAPSTRAWESVKGDQHV